MAENLACSYSHICSGCDWILRPYFEQIELKEAILNSAWQAQISGRAELKEYKWPKPKWLKISAGQTRDRVDLMIDRRNGNYRLGLFDRFQNGIVDLQGCPQMSPGLESWFQEFRNLQIPVTRGSVRLRVSPHGNRGIWFDFANLDIKTLLTERTTLDFLRSQSTLEIGQKRKRLVERDGLLKLDEAELGPWFETYIDDSSVPVPLYTTIGGFTQPGFKVNRALVGEVRRMVGKTSAKSVTEFGAGIGNFTIPLAAHCDSVRALEIDRLAIAGLEKSLSGAGFSSRVEIMAGDFQRPQASAFDFSQTDLVFADPPRSGLLSFLKPLVAESSAKRPRHFIYVSCFAESFAQDAAALMGSGYGLEEITIIDQFPQSRHFELIAHFTLD
jgi:23S rRNA (uracil1939-C5)-methyltransferase